MNFLITVLFSTFIVLPIQAKSSDGARDSAKDTTIRLAEISNALEIFYFDCGHYPKNLEGLLKNNDGCPQWGPASYLTNPNLNDHWGRPIDYSVNTINFKLISYGADGAEGGIDQDMDIVWTPAP